MKRERPDDLTEREMWAWQEAEFCDRMVESFRGMIDQWIKRGSSQPSNCEGALRCALSAECWDMLATHLRKSYYSRKEAEAYAGRVAGA